MIKISECIINKVSPLKHWSLTITLLIKREDYTNEDRLKLEELWSEWTSLVWVLQEFGEEKVEDNKPKLRTRLAIIMQEYAKLTWKTTEQEENEFYIKYNIKSRTELTQQELKACIDEYEAWKKVLELWLN